MQIRWEDLERQRYEDMASVLLSHFTLTPSESMVRAVMVVGTCKLFTD